MLSLNEIYLKHKNGDWPDKNSVHSYLPVYEELLAPYRHTAKNVLEIGLMSGESLRMWDEYFDGMVYGMDCDIKPIGGKADLSKAIQDGLGIIIADATNPEQVKEHLGATKFDVIIEDANHDIVQQLEILATLRPYLTKGGIYIIEDIQDVDKNGWMFTALGGEIIDRRHVKNRYDDVLVIFRN